jgi:hypothetical protein
MKLAAELGSSLSVAPHHGLVTRKPQEVTHMRISKMLGATMVAGALAGGGAAAATAGATAKAAAAANTTPPAGEGAPEAPTPAGQQTGSITRDPVA